MGELTTALSGIPKRSCKVGIEVVDAASQGNGRVGGIDLEIEVDPSALRSGVMRGVRIQVDLPEDPVDRLALAIVDHQRGFEVNTAVAFGSRFPQQAVRRDHEVHHVAGDRSVQIGIVSTLLWNRRLTAGRSRTRCDPGTSARHPQGKRNLGRLRHPWAQESRERLDSRFGRRLSRRCLDALRIVRIVATTVSELVAGLMQLHLDLSEFAVGGRVGGGVGQGIEIGSMADYVVQRIGQTIVP